MKMTKDEMAQKLLLAHIKSQGLRINQYYANIIDMSRDEMDSWDEEKEGHDAYEEWDNRDQEEMAVGGRFEIVFKGERFDENFTNSWDQESLNDDLEYQFCEAEGYEDKVKCNSIGEAFNLIRGMLGHEKSYNISNLLKPDKKKK